MIKIILFFDKKDFTMSQKCGTLTNVRNKPKKGKNMLIQTEGVENDIDRKAAIQSGYNTSFDSERIGNRIVDDYISTIKNYAEWLPTQIKDERQEVIAQEVFDKVRARLRDKVLAWICARSRCASSAIVGGSGFNVRQAEKRNDTEHKRLCELVSYQNTMKRYATRRFSKVIPTLEKNASELEQLKAKLDKAEKRQEFMKEVNVLIRKKDLEGLKKHLLTFFNGKEHLAQHSYNELTTPNYFGRLGYERCQLTNNLANIKRMRERVRIMGANQEKAETIGEKAHVFNGLAVVENFTEDRLQLLFDEKPSEAVRGLLKSNGFRWSPRHNAWQRKLTPNAKWAFKFRLCGSDTFKQLYI